MKGGDRLKEKEDAVIAQERNLKRKQGDKILDTIGMVLLVSVIVAFSFPYSEIGETLEIQSSIYMPISFVAAILLWIIYVIMWATHFKKYYL